VVRRVVCLAALLGALAGFAPLLDSRILFPAGTDVPRPVQAFAWRVIQTRCNYQASERDQRSFFAYDARATSVATGVVYSIRVRSDLTWRRWEPTAFIDMTVVDDGGLRLTALTSSFVVCRDAR
jgi:hypothetical protein